MKYNDYIILTDEDYNNMKSKFNHLDEFDKEKLLDIYNKMLDEYRELESIADDRYIGILELSKKHIDLLKTMLTDSGVEVESVSSETLNKPSPETKSPYHNPLRRLFMLGRPMPPPPRPPYNPGRKGIDIIDLLLLYLITRPHSRFASNICNMAHERLEALSKFIV